MSSAPQATTSTAPAAVTLNARGIPKETYYDSANDSGCANFARFITCNCCGQKSTITTENVTIRYWAGCTYTQKSMDIDSIQDVQLRETFGPCLWICGRGDIRIYGQDGDQKDKFFTVKNVENAGKVYVKLGELTQKINDLKYGISRPDQGIPPVIYNSQDDPCCIKCMRTSLCGCFRPTTVVTKSGVSQSAWEKGRRITRRMDFDKIKDLQLRRPCCEMICGAGTIRVFGQDEDQKGDHFDIKWVSDVQKKYDTINNFASVLNNRQRVGFIAATAAPQQ